MRCWFVLLSVVIVSPLAAQEGKVAVKIGKEKIDFFSGSELITTYHTTGFAKPIFWPLNAPGNVPLTRAWPMDKSIQGEATDHIHQKSAWFCHGDVIPEGMELKHKIRGVEGVDFWSEAVGHGKMVVTEVGEPKIDGNKATLITKNEWRTADDSKIMDETRVITLVDYGKARLIVLDIDFVASAAPITFADTKEGSMGIRINDQIRADAKGKGQIKNAEGKVGEKECWGQVSTWCDYLGPIGDKTVGLAIFADPTNPCATAWHSRGYGLMAANPFGRVKSAFPAMKGRLDTIRLAKDAHLRLRYALLAHEGDTDRGQVAEYFRRFAELRTKE